MATQSRTNPPSRTRHERGLLGQIEVHSIDWIPDTERHGKTWQQAMLWFLGNFQYFTIPIGFVGPALGLSLGWSILAGVLGIAFGTLFMAFHATQGPVFGLPQMIQTRAQLGYRGVIVALFAVLFTYMAFNVADQVLMASGLHGAFGWSAALVAVGHRGARRGAGDLRLRLGAPGVPVPAGHLVPVLRDHLGRDPGRARRRHAGASPGGFVFAAFMAQFSVAAAYNITYAPYVSDYSRYMPRNTSPRGIIAAVFFGASGSAVWLIALGAWLATRLGVSDGLVGLQTVGDNIAAPLGSVTAFLSATALLATMGMNAYGGMLTVLTGIDSFKKVKTSRAWRVVTIVVLAVIWYAIGAASRPAVDRGQRGAGLADADAVPAGPVDRAEPGRLLLRPPRALRDHRHLPPGRRLRRLGLARPDRVLRRVRSPRSRSWCCRRSPACPTPAGSRTT